MKAEIRLSETTLHFKGHSEVVGLTLTEALYNMNVQNSESLLQAYGQISPTAHHTLIRPENTVGITRKQTFPATQAPLWTPSNLLGAYLRLVI